MPGQPIVKLGAEVFKPHPKFRNGYMKSCLPMVTQSVTGCIPTQIVGTIKMENSVLRNQND